MARAELLYATTNPGKLQEVSTFLGETLPVKSPRDFGLEIEVEETGQTLEENALLKARAYRPEVPHETIVMADDTGLEIDALEGEPGVKVRRWLDGEHDATDDEIIDYCLERMKDVPPGKRGAQFRTVIALALPDATEQLFDGTLRGEIAEQELDHERWEGFPFRGLFLLPETGKYLGELEDAPDVNLLTHRQKAAQKAADWLKAYNT